MSGSNQIGRLAMRVEGDWWVAYYAEATTMEGALDLGRIQMACVKNKHLKDAFMALMKAAVAELLATAGIRGAVWPEPPRRAPEHERSGSA